MTPRTALIALHIGVLLFGLTGILGKLADTFPVMIVFGRAATAVLALTLLMPLMPGSRWVRLSWAVSGRFLLGGLFLAGHWVTFFIAVKVGGVAIATVGFASFPAFTALFESVLFHERLRNHEILLIILITLGLILVAPNFDLTADTTVGLLWAILSGILFATYSICNRGDRGGIGAIQAALCQNLVVTLCVLPFAAPFIAATTALDWLWMAMLGIFCTGVAHSLFVASLTRINARSASVVFALEPVYGILFAWWLFGEQPTLNIVFGAALIIIAIAVSARLNAAHAPKLS